MSAHDIAILISAIAGFCMVIGGMLLIWKGAIVLAGTDSSTALSIEWKKDFKLNTQAPGIAFFILGLSFSSIAIYFSIPIAPKPTDPIYIAGTFDNVDEIVTITAVPSGWEVTSGSNGVVDGKFIPDTEILNLKFSAPGYQPAQIPQNLSKTKDRVIRFDKPFKLIKSPVPTIESKQENIKAAIVSLPPLGSQPSFGAAQ